MAFAPPTNARLHFLPQICYPASASSCSAAMDIPSALPRLLAEKIESSSSSSSISSSSSFHTPECSCSPSCSFHPPFSSLHDENDPSSSSSSPGDLSIEEVLPVEVMQHVLGFVPLGQLAGDVARTSRLWRSLALDPALWLPHWRRLHFARPSIELPENDARRGVQPPPEGEWGDERGGESDPWLLDAGRSLQQAFDEDYPIDWRREYLRRKNLRVLVVTYHTSHSNHYDMDTIRQLKKFGIDADICHLMCNHDVKAADTAGGFYNYVEFDDNLFMKYDTIIYFAAMSGGEAMKRSLGDSLLAFLKSGGGVIFCIYTHMKSYQLQGKWTESFYPIKPANRTYPLSSDPHHQKREKSKHSVMSGVRNTQIDTTRLGSRCMGNLDPLAKVLGEYDDGVPLVVVLDGEANRAKAWEVEEQARREEHEASPEEQQTKMEAEHSEDGERSPDNSDGVGESENKHAADHSQEQAWGKTVFLNFFPVSKDDPCTGGWYDWNSDIPLLLRNAVLFAARKGPSAPSAFSH